MTCILLLTVISILGQQCLASTICYLINIYYNVLQQWNEYSNTMTTGCLQIYTSLALNDLTNNKSFGKYFFYCFDSFYKWLKKNNVRNTGRIIFLALNATTFRSSKSFLATKMTLSSLDTANILVNFSMPKIRINVKLFI